MGILDVIKRDREETYDKEKNLQGKDDNEEHEDEKALKMLKEEIELPPMPSTKFVEDKDEDDGENDDDDTQEPDEINPDSRPSGFSLTKDEIKDYMKIFDEKNTILVSAMNEKISELESEYKVNMEKLKEEYNKKRDKLTGKYEHTRESIQTDFNEKIKKNKVLAEKFKIKMSFEE